METTWTAQHTEIPWELAGNTIYGQDGKGIAQAAWEAMAEFNIGDHAIFLERSEKVDIEARANAVLIVRAVNSHYGLLEACKGIVEASKCRGGAMLEIALYECEAAIAKAERATDAPA